ncbi:MAG: hypothetical protein KAH22_04905 [Thiotrichaceae bacterium]|nr:hypothetical protein [Thiotrichaceae bacterium]
MIKKQIYTVISSPFHPRLSALYTRFDLQEQVFTSMRKVMTQIKKQAPAYLVADFIYGYSNHYAGVNISNVDVLLMSMQRYCPETKVIILAKADEIQYVVQLERIMPLYGALKLPLQPNEMIDLLTLQESIKP